MTLYSDLVFENMDNISENKYNENIEEIQQY